MDGNTLQFLGLSVGCILNQMDPIKKERCINAILLMVLIVNLGSII